MAKNKEINKNTKFYKKEMRKWESRISISLTLIMIGIMSFLFIFLKMNDCLLGKVLANFLFGNYLLTFSLTNPQQSLYRAVVRH